MRVCFKYFCVDSIIRTVCVVRRIMIEIDILLIQRIMNMKTCVHYYYYYYKQYFFSYCSRLPPSLTNPPPPAPSPPPLLLMNTNS